ncbi:MAG: AmmeMemoRadiSam system radical SAM enzyme [Candidatus Pacearchaeota archaeon]
MEEKKDYKKAEFWKLLKDKIVKCELCPHFCVVKEGEYGKCKVRKNINGQLIAMSYEKPVSVNIDRIEKKPLYHFLPGTLSYSIGMAGCNLGCSFCQNWELSQKSAEELFAPKTNAKEIVNEAIKSGCPSISYTYSEPTVSYEFVFEMAEIARKKGLKNVLVSNGFINPEPLKKLCKYVDAANIDLKGITEDFYSKICGARLKPVLEALKIFKKQKVWLEITNLIIPGFNDSRKDIEKLVLWVKKNLGDEVPLHFSAFYPMYKMIHVPGTTLKKLKEAREIALRRGLKYVYTGNLPDEEGNTTYCFKCKNPLIRRSGFSVIQNKIIKGKCTCGKRIAGVWF